MLPLLVGLGFDELSMSYSSIPEIKSGLGKLDSAECRRLAETAAKLSRSRDVEALLDSFRGIAVKEELITPQLIRLHSDSRSKAEALQELAIMMEAAGREESRAEAELALWRREDTGSTSVGFGVAVPHYEMPPVRSASIAFLRFTAPFYWDSSDGQPVDMAVMLAIPKSDSSRDHLKILTRLSRRLVHEEFRQQLRNAGHEEAVLGLIAAAAAAE
jgi:fructose-specific PTS system IIA-like component